MESKYDKIKNFDMTLAECRLVLESIGGLVVVDAKGRIKFFSSDIYKSIEATNSKELPENLIGKPIAEVHPTTKIMKALNEDAKDEIKIYSGSGTLNVTRIIPMIKDGKLEGVVDLDLFANSWDVSVFYQRIQEMKQKGKINLPETVEQMEEQNSKIAGFKYTIADIVGKSHQMEKLREDIYKLVESTSTVLIYGETGTGKEIVAHAIHGLGGRQVFPFMEVNCAAIPESLFESEFFGYEEGSFTGATKGGKAGIFEQADHGTIFFDEIDQIPYNMQPKLLRALQEHEISRIGSKKVPVDVRIIAATNKDLRSMILNKKFREDLYYRLNVVTIQIPPLREHKEDIPNLVEHRIEYLNKVLNRSIKGITKEAMSLLCQYDWPGNVRELFNIIERSINLCEEDLISADYFGELLLDIHKGNQMFSNDEVHGTLDSIMAFVEKDSIIKALAVCGKNKTQAAKLLGISRTALHHKITKHKIENHK